MKRRRDAGFTLLELLVAMAIFAVIGAMALGGLNAIVTQQSLAESQMQELVKLQRAVRYLTTDFENANPRIIRDPYLGNTEVGPVIGGEFGFVAQITRGGWNNPADLPRGTLQRVQYRLEDGVLYRDYWPVLDLGAADLKPRSEKLLDGVEDLTIYYLGDPGGECSLAECERWPPLARQGANARPRAVRVNLRLTGWGEIERRILVTG